MAADKSNSIGGILFLRVSEIVKTQEYIMTFLLLFFRKSF